MVLGEVTAIAAGGEHSVFLKADGTVWATGRNNYGQLGNNSTTDRTTLVQVLSGAAAIATGSSHSLFLKTDGTVWATGRNTYGQLGDGTTTSRSTPVQVLSGVKAIAASEGHSLFLKIDGTVWATGKNGGGQLGDGMGPGVIHPVLIRALNAAPTDLTLSLTTLAENNAPGATVGTLAATDPDAGDTHVFSLVSGPGSTDNAAFTITGGTLTINLSADHETQAAYLIRVRATDANGLFFEKAFVITVTDVTEIDPGFASWTNAAGLSGTDAEPTAAPFGDGVPNLLKYAFNMNAAGPDASVLTLGGTSGLPRVAVDTTDGQTVIAFEFLRRRTGSLAYEAQESTDLADFTPLVGTVSTAPIDDDWERVIITPAASASPTRFFRVRVTQ